jgi:hypothetical protein
VGTKARFNDPSGLAFDQKTNNLFACDVGNHSIRMITPQGTLNN